MAIIIAIHVIVCVALIGIILIQRGRGGGFVDSFQGLESVFGTKTSAFLTKSTTVLATLFFVTCLSLAFFSLRQSKSLIRATSPVSPPVEKAVPSGQGAQGQAPAAGQPQQSAPAGQPQQPAPAGQPQSAAPSAPSSAPAAQPQAEQNAATPTPAEPAK